MIIHLSNNYLSLCARAELISAQNILFLIKERKNRKSVQLTRQHFVRFCDFEDLGEIGEERGPGGGQQEISGRRRHRALDHRNRHVVISVQGPHGGHPAAGDTQNSRLKRIKK